MVKSILIILVQMMINYGILSSLRFYTRRNNQGLRLADKGDDLASYSERKSGRTEIGGRETRVTVLNMSV